MYQGGVFFVGGVFRSIAMALVEVAKRARDFAQAGLAKSTSKAYRSVWLHFQEWCDEHLKGEEDDHFHFHASEQILKDAGFPMERVHRLETHKGIEPGQQIVYHIKHDHYGTIVMGRRGKDVGKGVFRGVSDRVLANVENVAIWIVG